MTPAEPPQDSPQSSPQVLAGRTYRMMRRAHGLSLASLAGLIGVSEGHLSRIERGEREVSRSLSDRITDVLASLERKAS